MAMDLGFRLCSPDYDLFSSLIPLKSLQSISE